MKNIDQLIKELIPPADYQHRNGFSNKHMVLKLKEAEKTEVEQKLIEMLETEDDDLIGETLVILKSTSSIPTLRKRLGLSEGPPRKIMWASYINEIKNGDEEMKEIALNEIDKIVDNFSLISVFHYLAQFRDSKINDKINNYINHEDFLVAVNARKVLGMDAEEIYKRERAKKGVGTKKWWEIWK